MFLNSCPVLTWAELPLLAWHFDLPWESSFSLLRNSSITYKITHLICWAHTHYSHIHLAFRSSLRGGRAGKHHGLGKITFSSCEGIHYHGKVRKKHKQGNKKVSKVFPLDLPDPNMWMVTVLQSYRLQRSQTRKEACSHLQGLRPLITTNKKVNNFIFCQLALE